MKLLHLDDNAHDLELVKLRLQQLDPELEIVSCTSAVQALKKIQGEHFDCVISDYKMPKTNGIDFLIMLKDSGWKGPFIFFSGHDSEELINRAMRHGADDYFTKEHSNGRYQVLFNAIRKFIRLHRHLADQEQLEDSRDWEASVNAAMAAVGSPTLANATPRL